MPRKPKHIYVLLEPQPTTGSQPPSSQAWKLDLQDGEKPADTLERNAHLFPVGHTLVTVTDLKVDRYSTNPSLTEVET